MDSFRTFIAIELPHHLRAIVREHIARLRRELPGVRASWSRDDNLHLTLKFLGNVPVGDISKVSDAVGKATKASSPFQLTIAGSGTFPSRGRPSVLWLGAGSAGLGSAGILAAGRRPLARSLPLSSLHSTLETELDARGFARDSRAFHPHLTIARLRHPKGARELASLHQSLDFPPQSFDVSEVVVFRSELLKEGSRHTALSKHAVGARASCPSEPEARS